jgi:aryl-alcohol dehydrogenase-like predicted oxidoreductase
MRIRDSAIVRRAVELGAGFLDTADIYGLNWQSTERFRDGRREYLRHALEASLQRLRRDYVELYTLHRHDPEVPIEESVGAIDELRREGKCLAVGVSNVSLDQLMQARSVCEITAVQNEFNRGFLVSEPVLEECERSGIWFMPWAPLGEGLGEPRDEVKWLLDRSPVTVPIPGTSSIEHLEELMC